MPGAKTSRLLPCTSGRGSTKRPFIFLIRLRFGASNKPLSHKQEASEKHASPFFLRLDETEKGMPRMTAVLLWLASVQAVRPTRHWWPRPRGLAWFQVLMIVSLVKRPASAGLLSRIGDYLLAARGPGLLLRIRRCTTFPHHRVVTRGPPDLLFHRRRLLPNAAAVGDVAGHRSTKDPHRQGSAPLIRRCRAG